MMKITSIDVCIANPWFHPILKGPGERFRRYAPGLRERGVDLRVMTVKEPDLPTESTVDGIRVRRMRPRPDNEWGRRHFFYALLPSLLRQGRRPDVLQLFGVSRWDVPFVIGLRALGIPSLLVFTMMGQSREGGLKGWVSRLHRRALFEPFDCIVTSSRRMTEEVRSVGACHPWLRTIPNGVDLDRFRPAESEVAKRTLRRRLDLPQNRKIVTFVGGVYPRKAVDVLLQAWQRIVSEANDCLLLLVGPRPDDEAKYVPFLRRVDKLTEPVSATVRFEGVVRNVEDYLRASDLFVFPSRREGMPNVVPEAMACALPCVMTPFTGLPVEFGEPGEQYVMAERTPRALASTVSNLLARPEAGATLGRAAREWVERHLDVERSLDRYAELYIELARRRRADDGPV